MNWINTFEIICYLLTVLLLGDIAKQRNRVELRLFLAATMAGFILEILAVRATDIYHYSNDYFLSIGAPPNQFPVFGGLMWGALAVCGFRIARKFSSIRFEISLFTGWLVVSMDLLLDVAAIRLNGGFWIWDGRVLSWDINHHVFMSVIWVNFLGYLFETPAVVYLTLRLKKLSEKSRLMAILAVLGAGLGAVITVGVGSSLSLLLNKISDEWFAFVAFLVLWMAILVKLVAQIAKRWHTLTLRVNQDFVLGIFWAVIYGYCLVALWSLGAFHTNIAYALLAVFIALATLLLSLVSTNAYAESD